MNQAEVLCHSSGPWKKHKYFQKIGEGANAVYKYAKKNITGSDYKKEAKDEKQRSEYANDLAGSATKNLMVGRNVDDVKTASNGNQSADFTFRSSQNWADSAAYHGRKAAEAQSNYNKSLFGNTEKTAKKTVAKGEKILKDFFKSKVTKTVTDVSTGKKRTPNNSGTTVNVKTGKVTRR